MIAVLRNKSYQLLEYRIRLNGGKIHRFQYRRTSLSFCANENNEIFHLNSAPGSIKATFKAKKTNSFCEFKIYYEDWCNISVSVLSAHNSNYKRKSFRCNFDANVSSQHRTVHNMVTENPDKISLGSISFRSNIAVDMGRWMENDVFTIIVCETQTFVNLSHNQLTLAGWPFTVTVSITHRNSASKIASQKQCDDH